jgi:hypothetical protein
MDFFLLTPALPPKKDSKNEHFKKIDKHKQKV